MAACCPKTFTGFCLDDNTPIAITLDNGVIVSWTNLVTGVVTPGNPPAGTGICEVPSTVTVDIEPLTCEVDSVTVCQGTTPWVVTDPPNLDCLTDSVTVCQGTTPWVVSGSDFDIRPLDCATDSVTICPPVSGIFDVEVTNEVNIRPLDCLTDSIEVCQGTTPWVVSGSPLDCATDSVTICPPVSGIFDVEVTNEVNIRPLDCLTDSVAICVDGPLVTVPGRRTLLGLYYGTMGPTLYTSAADAATGGDLWLVNTSASVVAYIREVHFTVVISDLALLTALPTIRMERITFTGTPSGASITPAKRDSVDATNTATLRTANTGMAITAGAAIRSFAPPSSDVIGGLLSANAAVAVPTEQVLELDLEGFIVLRQNEGVVFRQNTGGSTPENRQYWLNIAWEEI